MTSGVFDPTLAYDASGNITGITDAGGARTQTFHYDSLNHLARAGGTGAPSLQSASYSYGATSHKLTSVTAAAPRAFTYLSSGQMSSETDGATTKTYTYDAEGRLVLIQTNGVTTAASDYDAAGQRVSSTVAGATTHF
ncbi:MAG: hypothetical protein ABL957_17100, partial [Parvularculaceae bacterium]